MTQRPPHEEVDQDGALRMFRQIRLLAGVEGDAPASYAGRDGTKGLVEGLDRVGQGNAT